MAKIAKTYRTLWKEGMKIAASDVRRAFDDAYDLVNGGLDSSNFIQQITFNASGIPMPSQAFTGTVLTQVLDELKMTNEHTLHCLAFNSRVVSVFPGFIYVNGVRCRVPSRLNITASNHYYTGGANVTGLFALMFQAGSGNTITATDVFVTLASNISQSLSWDNNKQGYYPSIGSGTKRAIAYIRAQTAANVILNEQYLDPPWNSFVYDTGASEATALGLSEFLVTQTSGFDASILTTTWEGRDKRYTYTVRGAAASVTGSSLISTMFCGTGFQVSGFAITILDGVFAAHQNNEHYPYQPQIADNNAFSVLNEVGAFIVDNRTPVFASADFSIRFGRVYKNYRNRADRG